MKEKLQGAKGFFARWLSSGLPRCKPSSELAGAVEMAHDFVKTSSSRGAAAETLDIDSASVVSAALTYVAAAALSWSISWSRKWRLPDGWALLGASLAVILAPFYMPQLTGRVMTLLASLRRPYLL